MKLIFLITFVFSFSLFAQSKKPIELDPLEVFGDTKQKKEEKSADADLDSLFSELSGGENASKEQGILKLSEKEDRSCEVHQRFGKVSGKYIGSCTSGIPDGRGRVLFDNGDTYSGEVLNSKISGYGTLIRANATEYTGQFLENMPHGEGVEKHPNLTIRGTFYKGGREGKASVTSDSFTAEGIFRINSFKGSIQYKDGSSYVGYAQLDESSSSFRFTSVARGEAVFIRADGYRFQGEIEGEDFLVDKKKINIYSYKEELTDENCMYAKFSATIISDYVAGHFIGRCKEDGEAVFGKISNGAQIYFAELDSNAKANGTCFAEHSHRWDGTHLFFTGTCKDGKADGPGKLFSVQKGVERLVEEGVYEAGALAKKGASVVKHSSNLIEGFFFKYLDSGKTVICSIDSGSLTCNGVKLGTASIVNQKLVKYNLNYQGRKFEGSMAVDESSGDFRFQTSDLGISCKFENKKGACLYSYYREATHVLGIIKYDDYPYSSDLYKSVSMPLYGYKLYPNSIRGKGYFANFSKSAYEKVPRFTSSDNDSKLDYQSSTHTPTYIVYDMKLKNGFRYCDSEIMSDFRLGAKCAYQKGKKYYKEVYKNYGELDSSDSTDVKYGSKRVRDSFEISDYTEKELLKALDTINVIF